MTAAQYYAAEKQRRLARAPRRLWGPSGEDIGVIYIPSKAVLDRMREPTLTETLRDLARRRERARRLGVKV